MRAPPLETYLPVGLPLRSSPSVFRWPDEQGGYIVVHTTKGFVSTMDNYSHRLRRKIEIKARASTQSHMYKYCRIIGCGKPTRAGTPDGLDTRYCRSHADQLQRHGSPYKKSYSARMLNPYRRAALAWLEANQENSWVRNALERVNSLYRGAGSHEEAFRLRGKKPHERAKIHWARLRKARIDPLLVVAAWLSVEMVIKDNNQPVYTNEFRRVQAAKVIHRMASGSHRRWEQEIRDLNHPGRMKIHVTEMHVYPRSRGRILRHIGADLERAVELLVDHHLKDIQQFKKTQEMRGSFSDRPYPKGTVSRKRKNS